MKHIQVSTALAGSRDTTKFKKRWLGDDFATTHFIDFLEVLCLATMWCWTALDTVYYWNSSRCSHPTIISLRTLQSKGMTKGPYGWKVGICRSLYDSFLVYLTQVFCQLPLVIWIFANICDKLSHTFGTWNDKEFSALQCIWRRM